MTKSQLDRLGSRLKLDNVSDADLRLLDEFRGSHADALDLVVKTLRKQLAAEPAARIKLSRSIIEKLRRGNIQLSRMQDIAGCRMIVDDIMAQKTTLELLGSVFADAKIVDRRMRPSHGYRAIHAIVRSEQRWVEIQVRTSLQHLWAELSEKLSDMVGTAIKYGGGPANAREVLLKLSELIFAHENRELEFLTSLAPGPPKDEVLAKDWVERITDRADLEDRRRKISKWIQSAIESLSSGENDAVSN